MACLKTLVVLSLISAAAKGYRGYRHRYPTMEMVDLTHPFNENTRYLPALGKRAKFSMDFFTLDAGGERATSAFYKGVDHSGTHIDAPFHLDPNGMTVDEIPLGSLIAPASVIHLGHKVETNHDYVMTVQDILEWEARNGKTIDNTILLVDFNWNRFYGDIDLYLTGKAGGLGPYGNGTEFHCPGVHGDTARWIIKNRPSVHGLLLDTVGPDFVCGMKGVLPVHKAFLENGKYIVENLGGELTKLPSCIPEVIILPMKLDGGTGGPTRIVAKIWKWRY